MPAAAIKLLTNLRMFDRLLNLESQSSKAVAIDSNTFRDSNSVSRCLRDLSRNGTKEIRYVEGSFRGAF